METGYFLRVGNKTTCGGRILSGSPNHRFGKIATDRKGDTVSCGVILGTGGGYLGTELLSTQGESIGERTYTTVGE